MADKANVKNEVKEGRKLPYNLDAEQCALACALLDNEAAGAVLTELSENDFYAESHRYIYSAMSALYSTGTPIDFITLSGKMEQELTIDKVGGVVYITQLTSVLPSAANYEYYIGIVKETAVLRNLIKGASAIITNVYENPKADQAVGYAEKTIYDVTADKQKGSLKSISEVSGRTLGMIEQRCINGKGMSGLKTGFAQFDYITNGLQKSNLIVLAARPGIGKTAFALNIATNAALDPKVNAKVAIFNLEMSGEELVQRMYCSVGRISMSNVKAGNLTAVETRRLVETHKKLSEASIYIDDTANTNPLEIMSKCRRICQDRKLDLIVVDYLQLMEPGKKSESRQNDVSTMSRQMKLLARELDVPVILLSQMNRGTESVDRRDKDPMLSDLRESGAIEQDADIVLFLSKDPSSEKGDPEILVDLHIAKHRNGSTGKVHLNFIGDEVRFESLSKEEKAEFVKRKQQETQAEEAQENSARPVSDFDYDSAMTASEAESMNNGGIEGLDAPPPEEKE